ncbi:MAG TPA: cytochrome c [Terriglobales bacterium]
MRLGKILFFAVVALIVLLCVAISATIGWRPFFGPNARPLTSRKIDITPERLARGYYIFNSLSGCADCHSEHDGGSFASPLAPGMTGAGAEMALDGLPGRIVAPNLTPDRETGSGTWTDDQLARAIREGVGHDGRALFPIMPYQHYRSMSDEDLASVVAYLRALPAVHHELPKTEIIFPVKYLIRTVPIPVTAAVTAPDPKDQLKYGAYLVNLGGCIDCHTPADDKGNPLPGLDYAGGEVFSGKGFHAVATANITPDPSGISYYDEAMFIQVIRTGAVGARTLSGIMPYEFYKGLTDDDLKAMFADLKTLKPVHHRVDNTAAATFCKICRKTHGAGEQN